MKFTLILESTSSSSERILRDVEADDIDLAANDYTEEPEADWFLIGVVQTDKMIPEAVVALASRPTSIEQTHAAMDAGRTIGKIAQDRWNVVGVYTAAHAKVNHAGRVVLCHRSDEHSAKLAAHHYQRDRYERIDIIPPVAAVRSRG